MNIRIAFPRHRMWAGTFSARDTVRVWKNYEDNEMLAGNQLHLAFYKGREASHLTLGKVKRVVCKG